MEQDYKEKYEQALKRAKAMIKVADNQEETYNCAVTIFPELRESEDEKIRKRLIDFFEDWHKNRSHCWGIAITDILAWLEKQDGQRPTLPKWKYKKDHTPLLRDSIILNKYGCVARSPSGAIVSDVWVLDYDELAKLPKEVIEKQGEQKPVDNVGPKFHEGDWVVRGQFVTQIREIASDGYVNSHNGFIPFDDAKYFHLWTIQDAKAGDVLYTPKGCGVEGIFLIEGWKQVDDTGRTLCSDIGYRVEDDEIIAGGLGAIWWKGVIDPFYPATKEQRDLLFTKMKESGYKWDDEKKELKKIDNEEVNGEDYGIDGLWHAQRILEKTLGSVDGYQTDDGILDHKAAITAVKKLYEQKPAEWKQENVEELSDFENAMMHIGRSFFGKNAGLDPNDTNAIKEQAKLLLELTNTHKWSEEDERLLSKLQTYVDLECFDRECNGQDLIDWLRNLKERYAWKPSNEQIEALDFAADCIVPAEFCFKRKELKGLLEQLKKIREE